MVTLTAAMRQLVDEQRLGYMATVAEDGTPSVSPKGLTFVLDEQRIAVGIVRSPGTLANLRHCPVAEINVVDPIARTGYRFKGPCRVCEHGREFEELVYFLRAKGARSALVAVVVLTVEHAGPLVSPAYDLGASEHEIRTQNLARMRTLNSDLHDEG